MGLRAKQRQRVCHARHGAFVQAGIAGKSGADAGGGHRPHDQPHPGARVAAINHLARFGKPAHTHPVDAPSARRVALHIGAKGAHGLGGIEHILPL